MESVKLLSKRALSHRDQSQQITRHHIIDAPWNSDELIPGLLTPWRHGYDEVRFDDKK
jgi:hypothetical protein